MLLNILAILNTIVIVCLYIVTIYLAITNQIHVWVVMCSLIMNGFSFSTMIDWFVSPN